jgi:hypothetical protein
MCDALPDAASALLVDDVSDTDSAAVVAALSRYSLPLVRRTAASDSRTSKRI